VKRKRKLVVIEGKTNAIGLRLGDIEDKMLVKLVEYWRCNKSEAVRRCIVYTYIKFLLGADISEETLIKLVEYYLKFGKLLGETSG